jgi:predicted transcriptional regulator
VPNAREVTFKPGARYDTLTISLPPAMAKQMEKVQKAENRTRSELLREAWRHYFESRYRLVGPTKAELVAIRQGRAEIRRGQLVTLQQLLHDLDTPDRKASRKRVPKSAR